MNKEEIDIMLWGRYKGEKIEDIPSWYLKWVAETFEEPNDTVKAVVKACDDEYQFREKYNCHI